MRRWVMYLRVSALDQTTANQERELREIAGRMGCDVVRVYKDHGISGTRGRDKRPAFDKLCRDAARREFDMVMAWSVDRLSLTCAPVLRAMTRKPSCLISCSHWLPHGSLSVLDGRHGAMNPAGKVRCNMWTKNKMGHR